MIRDSFVFYKSFYEAINNLEKEDQLEVYNAICEYSFSDNIPETLTGVAKAMFILIKPNIDSANARYKASVENGKKGGRPRKNKNLGKPNNNLDETQQEPKSNLNDNVDDNVYDNKKENNKRKNFIKPILVEVQKYCEERKNGIHAEKFVDYYDSIGWLVGKKPMKDWKACVRTWEKKEKEVKVSKSDISTPDWFNKKIEKKQDNLEELEDILNDFGG